VDNGAATAGADIHRHEGQDPGPEVRFWQGAQRPGGGRIADRSAPSTALTELVT
jgi:hypothetical protein